jgi:hypothetical protein
MTQETWIVNVVERFSYQVTDSKKISRLLTGQPKDSVMPIELYVCATCGKPLNELLPQELQETIIVK